ncbi:MAG TPA: hypothetical protein VK083_21300 [Nocardia sp.]|uniref:hypothetical protein n=1 Tax=Nocardia sp. TaxID=1821 RepID=UPI002B4B77C0|nr:hypothetical protein [Nocardia sp.]HLS79326.1 hypothetical protein [Nocardia sp.]
MLRYYVKVHCCGPEWLVHVPAVDRWTVTSDKRSIEATARELIADLTGKNADSFTIDLVAGRAIGSPAEFAPACRGALRPWRRTSPA